MSDFLGTIWEQNMGTIPLNKVSSIAMTEALVCAPLNKKSNNQKAKNTIHVLVSSIH